MDTLKNIVTLIAKRDNFTTGWIQSNCAEIKVSTDKEKVYINYNAFFELYEEVAYICEQENADYEPIWLDVCDSVEEIDLSWNCEISGNPSDLDNVEKLSHALSILEKESDKEIGKNFNKLHKIVKQAIKKRKNSKLTAKRY